MQTEEVVGRLKELVTVLKRKHGWKQSFYSWGKRHVQQLNALFDYHPKGKMPAIYQLVKADFHPIEPLVLLDYTKLAHSRLHLYPGGWTDVIRQCRGIVFDDAGELVAFPWTKFFNFDGDIKHIPPGPFTVSTKYDGHLGIIFEYRGQVHVTTRGSFTSPTSVLAAQMMSGYRERSQWSSQDIQGTTLLVEVLHPQTRVHLEYPEERFILLGARSLTTLKDELQAKTYDLGQRIGLKMADVWQGTSIRELIRYIQDPKAPGEGFVACFSNGERLKFKCVPYVQWMIRKSMGKNPYAYVVQRLVDGDLKSKLPFMEEEGVVFARSLVRKLKAINRRRLPAKDRWRRMYELAPEKFRKDAFTGACREFAKSVE